MGCAFSKTTLATMASQAAYNKDYEDGVSGRPTAKKDEPVDSVGFVKTDGSLDVLDVLRVGLFD